MLLLLPFFPSPLTDGIRWHTFAGMPLTPDERRFLDWWERDRVKYRKRSHQIWLGLPLGAAFSLPILINFLAGRFWYRRADAVGASQFNPIVLIIAVALIAGFMGYISRRFRWEQYEERYHRLNARVKAEGVALENQENPASLHLKSE